LVLDAQAVSPLWPLEREEEQEVLSFHS
jgi:hypothetical protein